MAAKANAHQIVVSDWVVEFLRTHYPKAYLHSATVRNGPVVKTYVNASPVYSVVCEFGHVCVHHYGDLPNGSTPLGTMRFYEYEQPDLFEQLESHLHWALSHYYDCNYGV